MIKEKIEKVKALAIKKGEKDNKKTIENLVAFVIILIITIIAINTIWKKDNKSESNKNTNSMSKQLAVSNQTVNENVNTSNNDIEEKLKNILSKIQGVGDVDVLITYSRTSQIVPLYNEDLTESTTEETDKEGGTRKINENSTKKDIIYQEDNGEKTPITQSIVSPKIEGAIITAEGASNIEVKSNIISAVEAVTGIGSHKIQVFEMKK